MNSRAVVILFWSLLVSGVARAQGPVTLDAVDDQLDLAPHLSVLEDPAGGLQLAQVLRSDARFLPNRASQVSRGFEDIPVWLRFQATNRSARAVRWFLELGEPTLDHVELFVVRAHGQLERYSGGDALPFATRQLPYTRMSFELNAPAGDAATYFLRVESADVMRVPLRLYTPRAFTVHQQFWGAATWLCFGLLLMLATYNFFVHWVIKRAHHARFGLACIAFVFVLMCLQGMQAPLFAPNTPGLVARLLPVSMALACFAVLSFLTKVIENIEHMRSEVGLFRGMWIASGVLLAFSALAPVGLAVRGLAAVFLLVSPLGSAVIFRYGMHSYPELRLYRLSWYVLALSLPVPVLLYANVLPPWPPLEWALTAGFVVYCTLVSVALPVWASGIEDKLASANEQLTSNVGELRDALAQAERATRAKDDFLATMSHELRTPLNTIINLPQGLSGEFVGVRVASCSVCRATYTLDDVDSIGASTRCEKCSGVGTLIEGIKIKFGGDGARSLVFLKKIERAGRHLLQMVNGILDFSKIEAGHFQLSLEPVDLQLLIAEAVEQMVEIAQLKQIRIDVEASGPSTPFMADGLRLTQVLLNLLANAIKFSEPRTVVVIRRLPALDAEVIEVADSGIGIALEHQARIFAGFEQVHKGDTRKYGGTGLGLSISRSLVRMHGGELSVRSELGAGSTFVVRLPREAAS